MSQHQFLLFTPARCPVAQAPSIAGEGLNLAPAKNCLPSETNSLLETLLILMAKLIPKPCINIRPSLSLEFKLS